MGYFQDLFDSVNKVNASGFDPSKESYSSRIGEFQTTNEDVVTPTEATPDISQSFTNLGYDDPFQGLVGDTGELDISRLSSGYNTLLRDTDIGVQPDDYINFLNQEYSKEIENFYGEGNILEARPDKTLGFRKTDKTTEPTPKYRFEKSSTSGTFPRKDVYQRFDEETGEHITYDTQEAFEKAIEEYKKTTGQDLNAENK